MSVVTVIPYEQIPSEPLQRMLESFVSREGTDYGEVELSLTDKVNSLKTQLQRREILVVFDGESESFNLISAQEARALKLV